MKIEFREIDEKLKYSFVFEKDMRRNDKLIQSVHSDGELNLSFRKYDKIENGIEIIFMVDHYNLKGSREPLIFNPTKWIYDIDNNEAFVRAKDNLRLIWKNIKINTERQITKHLY